MVAAPSPATIFQPHSADSVGVCLLPEQRVQVPGNFNRDDGGSTMWAELMDELCEIHLGLKPKRRTGPSVGERLQAAYEKVMAKKAKG